MNIFFIKYRYTLKYFITTITSIVTLIALIFSINADTLSQYDKEDSIYNFFNPVDILKFPLDQKKLKSDEYTYELKDEYDQKHKNILIIDVSKTVDELKEYSNDDDANLSRLIKQKLKDFYKDDKLGDISLKEFDFGELLLLYSIHRFKRANNAVNKIDQIWFFFERSSGDLDSVVKISAKDVFDFSNKNRLFIKDGIEHLINESSSARRNNSNKDLKNDYVDLTKEIAQVDENSVITIISDFRYPSILQSILDKLRKNIRNIQGNSHILQLNLIRLYRKEKLNDYNPILTSFNKLATEKTRNLLFPVKEMFQDYPWRSLLISLSNIETKKALFITAPIKKSGDQYNYDFNVGKLNIKLKSGEYKISCRCGQNGSNQVSVIAKTSKNDNSETLIQLSNKPTDIYHDSESLLIRKFITGIDNPVNIELSGSSLGIKYINLFESDALSKVSIWLHLTLIASLYLVLALLFFTILSSLTTRNSYKFNKSSKDTYNILQKDDDGHTFAFLSHFTVRPTGIILFSFILLLILIQSLNGKMGISIFNDIWEDLVFYLIILMLGLLFGFLHSYDLDRSKGFKIVHDFADHISKLEVKNNLFHKNLRINGTAKNYQDVDIIEKNYSVISYSYIGYGRFKVFLLASSKEHSELLNVTLNCSLNRIKEVTGVSEKK